MCVIWRKNFFFSLCRTCSFSFLHNSFEKKIPSDRNRKLIELLNCKIYLKFFFLVPPRHSSNDLICASHYDQYQFGSLNEDVNGNHYVEKHEARVCEILLLGSFVDAFSCIGQWNVLIIMFNRVYQRLHKIFFLKYQNLQRQLVLNIYVWTIGHPVLHFRSQFPFSLLTHLAHRITMYIYDMIALHSQPSHSLIRRNVKKTQCLRKLAFSINIFNFAFHLIKSNFKAITA